MKEYLESILKEKFIISEIMMSVGKHKFNYESYTFF